MEFIYWLARVGKSRPTGYRWRKRGMIETINVEGKLFVTSEAISRFWQRAGRGEFSKKPRGAAAKSIKKKKGPRF